MQYVHLSPDAGKGGKSTPRKKMPKPASPAPGDNRMGTASGNAGKGLGNTDLTEPGAGKQKGK